MAKVCKIEGCEGLHKGNGYCSKHNDRFKKYGDPLGGPVFRQKRQPECSVDGCEKPVAGRQLCNKHYARWQKYGTPTEVAWEYGSDAKREWHLDDVGKYILRYEPENRAAGPNGYVYQHRHVMCEKLGRSLRKGENVHHRNGDRTDNRPENLELWTTGQPAGQRVQDRVRWHLSQVLQDFDAALLLDEQPDALRELAGQVFALLKED